MRGVGDPAPLAHPSEWYLFLVLAADSLDAYQQLCREVVGQFRIDTE
jgi:hypothetical protein